MSEKYERFGYPWDIIAGFFDQVSYVPAGVKKLEFEDEKHKICVYRMGTNLVRIDIQKVKE